MYEEYTSLLDGDLKRIKRIEERDTPDKRDSLIDQNSLKQYKDYFHGNGAVVCVVNQKGGCAKTTTAVNVSACLAKHGYKTLLIDADAQAQASLGLGLNDLENQLTLCDVLTKGKDIKKAILPTYIENLDMITACFSLSGAQLRLANFLGRQSILKLALQRVRINNTYDFIIIDCSPSLNLITINALVSSHYTLIPFQTHYYSLEGMKELFHTIDMIKDKFNPELETIGLLATLYDKRNKTNTEILEQVREFFKDKVFNSVIRLNVKLSEAPIYKKSIYDYCENSRGAEDYLSLTGELVHRVVMANKV